MRRRLERSAIPVSMTTMTIMSELENAYSIQRAKFMPFFKLFSYHARTVGRHDTAKCAKAERKKKPATSYQFEYLQWS